MPVDMVTVTGTYQHPDGSPMRGEVEFLAPALTVPDEDVIITGSVTATLDGAGHLEVDLVATDADGVDPTGWTYTVIERLHDAIGRVVHIALSKTVPQQDLADIIPTDPELGDYVLVPGPPGPPGPSGSSYEHTQSTPAATWQIPHGLGRYPAVTIVLDGRAALTDIEYPSRTLAVATFPSPIAGLATCS